MNDFVEFSGTTMRGPIEVNLGRTLPVVLILAAIDRLPELVEWKKAKTKNLTLNKTRLQDLIRQQFKTPDYDLEQDLVDTDLVVNPNPPKYLKGYITEEDYPFRLTKTKIILGTYEGFEKYLRGEA